MILPNKLREIGNQAFSGCSSLTQLKFPDNDINILPGAFSNCSGLTDVSIPGGVSILQQHLFAQCSGLSNVTLSNGISEIVDYAFSDCYNLSSIRIPVTLTTIGEGAFAYCENLSKVYYAGTEAQWKSIIIGLENDALSRSEIIYESTDTDSPSIPSIPEEPTDPDEPTNPDIPPTTDNIIHENHFTLQLPSGLDKDDYSLMLYSYSVSADTVPVDVKAFQESLAEKGTVEGIYDIHLEASNGDPYAGGMVTITLQMSLEPSRNYTVYHKDSRTRLTTRRIGNRALQFQTNNFSLFAVVSTPKPVSPLSYSSGGSGMAGFTSYVITAKAGPGGTISSPGENRFDAGTNVTYTVTPNAGYAVDKVIVDGTEQVSLTNGTYTFRLLNQPYTIEATFRPVSDGETAAPAAPAAPNPSTGDRWLAHLFG